MNARSRHPSKHTGIGLGAAFALPLGAVHRNMRRRNPYADLSALLDATRKLTDEEMAELQLELGYSVRALLIYERLLLGDPRNAFFRRRCEWLARLSMGSQPTVRRRAAPGRGQPSKGAKRAAVPTSPAAVRPLEIISVGR